MFGFNLGFDQTKYLIEQRKQNIETKARKTLEEEEKKNKQKEKEEIKKVIETTTNNINKIQINFHNSFVNKETQKAYDQIIEQNNKNEYDNIINNQSNINSNLSNNIASSEFSNSIKNPEKEVILMETYSQSNNKTILEESSLVNETANNIFNMSSTVKEESDEEGYGKEEFNYNDNNENYENDELFFKEEYLDMDEEDETEDNIDNQENNQEQINNISEVQNENSQSNCFINKKAGFEDLIFTENQDKNNTDLISNKDINNLSVSEGKIVFKNCKIGAIFQSHPFSNTLDSKKEEKDSKTLSKVEEKDKSITYFKENENIPKDRNYVQRNPYDDKINNKNNKINKENTTNDIHPVVIKKSDKKELEKDNNNRIENKQDFENEIPEEIEIVTDKFDYNKFLEESINAKDDIQQKLRDEMKRIIFNRNGREKEKNELKKDKINAVLQNLTNQKSDIITNHQDLDISTNKNDLSEYVKKDKLLNFGDSKNLESLRNFTDSLINDKLPKDFPFLLENPKFTFQNNIEQENSEQEEQNNEQQDIIDEFTKKYEEEIKFNIEKEGYPINENYLKSMNSDTIKNLTSNTCTIQRMIRENNKIENIFDNDLTNVGSTCHKEDQDLFADLNQEEDNNLFGETNIVNNESMKINEILQNIKKIKKEEPEEEKRDQLIVFDNFKDTQEFKMKQRKLEKIREKKMKQAELLKERMNMIMKEANNYAIQHDEKKTEKSSNPKNNFSKQTVIDTPTQKKDFNELSKSKNSENTTKNSQEQFKGTLIHNKDFNKKNIKVDQTPKHKSEVNVSSISDAQRTPVVIKRGESLKANKVIKQSNFKYNKLSNKNTVKSAITQVLLAGEVNKACREKILPIIDNCPCNNYIILFKGNTGRFDLKGIYTFDQQTHKVELLTCLTNSPILIDVSSIKNYYKYDIIQKEFKLLQETKQLSVIVDAVMLNSTKSIS